MGTSPKEPNTIADEHRDQDWPTRLTKPFFVSIHEVTQADYEAIIGRNPSMFKGKPRNPVEMVSWGEAVEFCQKLTQKEGLPYRLPTEAEWEYMCRGGTTTRWYFGNDPTPFGQHAWCSRMRKDVHIQSGSSKPTSSAFTTCMAMYSSGARIWYAYRLPNSSLTSSDLSLQARLNKVDFRPRGTQDARTTVESDSRRQLSL